MGHALQWHDAFREAYGHTPLYLSAADVEQEGAILPAFVVRRPFQGPGVCSMPFLDTGGPCSQTAAISRQLVAELVRRAANIGARAVELRCIESLDIEIPANLDKVTMILPLPDDPQVLWQGLKAKVRNLVRKAERAGLTVEFGGMELLDAFYAVLAVNMRELGSPVHSKAFFGAILQAFDQRARLALIRKDTTVVGGLLAIEFNGTLSVPWASSLREYFRLSPNMLLYWQTLRQACLDGVSRFDFGRSSRGVGTYRFKKQWGAEEVQLYWYDIPVKNKSIRKMSGNSSGGKLVTSIWKHLPLQMTMWLGPKIRKYLTQ
ncbi:MAG: GNAT family N-acetyltransferase [Bacteroidetes bacterium]|nr:GNAT family N-acetyltransferase [Bacteroidota bacterium]